MATFKIIRFGRPNGSDKYTIYLRITHGRRSQYRTLNRHTLPDEWDDNTSRFTKNAPNWRVENDILRMYEARASDILRGFERDGVPFDFDTFDAEMFRSAGAASKASPNLVQYARDVASMLNAEGRHGNSEIYLSLAVILEAYRPKATLGEITPAWLARLEHFMRAERGQKNNTISLNMRTLRACCNRAIKDGLVRNDWYPFAKYTIGHLDQDTPKRAISMADVEKIRALEFSDKDEELARDLFIFSLYTRGMNMADIAYLTPKSVHSGRIEYVRRKTHATYSIAINDASKAIMEKYIVEGAAYIFPILSEFHATAKQQRERIHRVTVFVNKALRAMAERIGISSEKFSFYAARHTYATALKERGASVEVISEAMGHTNLRTTQIYLRSFDKSVLDEADKLLL